MCNNNHTNTWPHASWKYNGGRVRHGDYIPCAWMVAFTLLASHGCFTRKLVATHVGVELWNTAYVCERFRSGWMPFFWSCDVEGKLGSLVKFDNNSWCSQICARAMRVPIRAGRSFLDIISMPVPNKMYTMIFEYGTCFPKEGRGIGCQHWVLSWMLLLAIGQSRKIKGNWKKSDATFQTIALRPRAKYLMLQPCWQSALPVGRAPAPAFAAFGLPGHHGNSTEAMPGNCPVKQLQPDHTRPPARKRCEEKTYDFRRVLYKWQRSCMLRGTGNARRTGRVENNIWHEFASELQQVNW